MTQLGLVRYDAMRAELAHTARVDEAKAIRDKAAALQAYARQRKDVELERWVAEIKVRAAVRIGELTKELEKTPGKKPVPAAGTGSKKAALATAGLTQQDAHRCEVLAEHSSDVESYIAEAVDRGESITIDGALRKVVQKKKKAKIVDDLRDVAAREAKTVAGVYDVVIIDPPWPMEKIALDVRPNQVAFDYPTMTEDEIGQVVIPCADACHVWLWTTHRFLPMAFRLLEVWQLKYVCTFVWHKPGGFQPIGLPQYNCEFALYARAGTPQFIETKALPTAFTAPRGAHSEKPEEFYDMVRRVTGGRRLDMFNRRAIPGFDVWGKEAAS